jgi:hypothetical protein
MLRMRRRLSEDFPDDEDLLAASCAAESAAGQSIFSATQLVGLLHGLVFSTRSYF